MTESATGTSRHVLARLCEDLDFLRNRATATGVGAAQIDGIVARIRAGEVDVGLAELTELARRLGVPAGSARPRGAIQPAARGDGRPRGGHPALEAYVCPCRACARMVGPGPEHRFPPARSTVPR